MVWAPPPNQKSWLRLCSNTQKLVKTQQKLGHGELFCSFGYPLFCSFGYPLYIHSDRGFLFLSQELKKYLFDREISSSKSTPLQGIRNAKGLIKLFGKQSNYYCKLTTSLKAAGKPFYQNHLMMRVHCFMPLPMPLPMNAFWV